MYKLINGESLLKVAERINKRFGGQDSKIFTPESVSTLLIKIYLKSPNIVYREVYSVYIRCAKCGRHVRSIPKQSYNYCPYCGEKFIK